MGAAVGVGLDHYVKWIKDNDYLKAEHILPHDVRVRELGTGKSRLGGQIPSKIDARINSKDLRGLRSPDAVTIKNADAIANKLAQQLSRYNDLRRI